MLCSLGTENDRDARGETFVADVGLTVVAGDEVDDFAIRLIAEVAGKDVIDRWLRV